MFTNSDLFFGGLVLAAGAIVVCLYMYRRSSRDAIGKESDSRCANAWIELQQRCMRLVEEDECGGADQEELHRAAAVYRTVIGEATGSRGSEFGLINYENRPDPILRY